MNVNFIKMFCKYCSQLDNTGYITIPVENVMITLDLETNSYEFKSECPKCEKVIYNSRLVK